MVGHTLRQSKAMKRCPGQLDYMLKRQLKQVKQLYYNNCFRIPVLNDPFTMAVSVPLLAVAT